jgi:hypothetical protein
MSGIAEIQLDETVLTPGATLSGRAAWTVDKPPRKIEIRLFWQTRGKGSEDIEVVDEIEVDGDRGDRQCAFSFTLPVQPYSFSGSLISLEWGVEVVVGRTVGSTTFTMAPDGTPLTLSH